MPARRWRAFLLFVLASVAVFFKPLADLVASTATSQLYSYILLIPFISVYLVCLRRRSLPDPGPLAPGPAIPAFLLAAVPWVILLIRSRGERGVGPGDYLFLSSLSFVMVILGGVLLFLGTRALRAAPLPFLFLLFMVPLPEAAEQWAMVMLQRTSASAAHAMLSLTPVPFWRDGMMFVMPGLTVEVAEECSGIHSTVVLFITSLLAGHFFLRTTWRKALLAALVFPIGVLRNGFRIVVISVLTAYVDPNVIKGPLHRQGGPIFFALSLVILFLVLLLLRKSERPGPRDGQP